jgi:hypothetical protein
MRNVPVATALAASLIGLLAGPAAAEPAAVVLETAPAPAPQAAAAPQAAPAPTDAARLRQVQEDLLARETLTLSGRRVQLGGLSLNPTALYSYVGRPDLVHQVRQRRLAKGLTIGAGAALAGIGATWGVLDAISTSWENSSNRFWCGVTIEPDDCQPTRHANMLPWAAAMGGGLVLAAGLAVPSDPLSGAQKRQLIDDHNRRRRANLGLSSVLDAAQRTANVRAAVQPDGRSGLLLASCAF